MRIAIVLLLAAAAAHAAKTLNVYDIDVEGLWRLSNRLRTV